MANHRLAHLDALRGWAILGVMGVHAGNQFVGPIHESTRDGARGVELFYTLSALTLFLTRRADEPSPTRSFFIRRFFRVAPMFWVTVGLYAMRSRVWNFGAPLEHRMPLPRAASLVFFVHGFSPSWLNGLFGEWSVATEMMFYALVPLLYVAITRAGRALQLTAGALVSGWLITELARRHPLVFYLLKRSPDPKHAHWLLPVAGVVIVAAGLVPRDLAVPLLPHHMLFELGFVPLILSLHLRPNAVLVNPVLCHLGRISYSLYLVHNTFIDHLTYHMKHLAPSSPGLAFALVLMMAGGAAVALASLTWRWVEQPCIALGKRWIERMQAGRPALKSAA
jgi:peptidoglycan/LPS O-acetylase OafA/YrhL